MMRRIFWTALLLGLALPISAQDSAIDQEHTRWIDSVLRSTAAIKPGMTREQLLKVFTIEGGTFTRLHRTYVYKRCPYIKVHVDFAAVENPKNLTTEMPGDKIVKVSRPFLQFSILD